MRALALVLLAGCHGGDLRALGNKITSLGGGACENRVIYESGSDRRTAVLQYDDGEHLTSYLEVYDGGGVGFWLKREYDDRGNLVRQIEDTGYDEASRHRWATWTYDDQDRVVDVEAHFGEDVSSMHYEYRPDGLIDHTTDEDDRVTRYTYRGEDPLVIDELHDGWGWRYTFARGRWLTRQDNLDADGVASSPTIYTYDDLERGHLARRDFSLDADGVPSEVDRYTWEDGRVVREAYLDQQVDYAYDWRGRLVERRWRVEDWSSTTTIEWAGDTPSRIERRDTESGELIEGWKIERGCARDNVMTIPLAPLNHWEDEIRTIDLGIDRREMWSSHGVL